MITWTWKTKFNAADGHLYALSRSVFLCQIFLINNLISFSPWLNIYHRHIWTILTFESYFIINSGNYLSLNFNNLSQNPILFLCKLSPSQLLCIFKSLIFFHHWKHISLSSFSPASDDFMSVWNKTKSS